MQRTHLEHGELIIVDAKLDDYEAFFDDIVACELRIRVFTNGEEALRQAPARDATFWVVNIRLPDMPGISLLKFVRRRQRRAGVIIAGDEYSAEDELLARAAGATAYVCKPPSSAWLQGFRLASGAHAIRAGPVVAPLREST
jgi:DNA-binding response OmpR family regulator